MLRDESKGIRIIDPIGNNALYFITSGPWKGWFVRVAPGGLLTGVRKAGPHEFLTLMPESNLSGRPRKFEKMPAPVRALDLLESDEE